MPNFFLFKNRDVLCYMYPFLNFRDICALNATCKTLYQMTVSHLRNFPKETRIISNWHRKTDNTLARDYMGDKIVTYIEGKREGEYKIYHRHNDFTIDRLNVKGIYVNDQKHGPCKVWCRNKNFVYCNYKNGELHGEYKEYSPKGQLVERSNFVDGKKHGRWIEWKYSQKVYFEYESDGSGNGDNSNLIKITKKKIQMHPSDFDILTKKE